MSQVGSPAGTPAVSAAQFLAARLDDEVVVLDLERAALLLLDAWSAEVWQACDGRTFDELHAAVGGSHARLRRALRDLETAGAVRQESAGWMRAPTRQV